MGVRKDAHFVTHNYNLMIEEIEWEISSLCNASCPQCPRNINGGATWPDLPLTVTSVDTFLLPEVAKLLQQVKRLYLCGTYGDPITNKHLLEIIKTVREINPGITIDIHTNGGLHSARYWQHLAELIDGNGTVYFAIDGLEDTNHLYRVNVDFDKAFGNALAYIKAGGTAVWDFIVFKHNEHQVDTARSLAKSSGFKKINFKKSSRFFDKNHSFIDKYPVLNSQQEVVYYLEPSQKFLNNDYEKIHWFNNNQQLAEYFNTTSISCYSKQIKKIFVTVEGYVFPCGWLHDRMYGEKSTNHRDQIQLDHLWEIAGGKHRSNIHHTAVTDIIAGDGSWFDTIEKSWTNSNRLERCGLHCGQEINLIKYQNDITYDL